MSHPVVARFYMAPIRAGESPQQGTYVGRTLRQCMAQVPIGRVVRVHQGKKYLGPLQRWGDGHIEPTTDGHYY